MLFSLSIDFVNRTLFGLAPSGARLFLVPSIVSVLAGILLARVLPEARGSGVPQTKEAYQLSGGAIPARVPLGKFLLGVLTIGSGQSMGREGPSVQYRGRPGLHDRAMATAVAEPNSRPGASGRLRWAPRPPSTLRSRRCSSRWKRSSAT